METTDHAAAAAILAIAVVQAFADPELLKQAPRRTFYLAGAATGLFLGAALLVLWSLAGRPLSSFGLAGWTGAELAVPLLAATVWPLLLASAFALCAGRYRAAAARYYRSFEHLMPHGRRELLAASLTGILAGIGEEIAFRGFLIWYLAAFLGTPAALAVSSAAFGLAHGYQGRRGIVFGTLAGLVLGGAYLASGSLLLAIWMHATYNVASFTLGYRLLADPGR